MDKIQTNDLTENPCSLQGLHVDFDQWIISYQTFCKRSTRTNENGDSCLDNVSKTCLIDTSKLIFEDIIMGNITFIQRNKRSPNIQHKENERFQFYDYILYRLLDSHSERNLIRRLARSKL